MRTLTRQKRSLNITLCSLLCLSITLLTSGQAVSQTPSDDDRKRALTLLWNESKPEDALPLLESLAKANPDDGEVAFALGFALLGHSKLLKDPEERKATRLRSRSYFVKAKSLGISNQLLLAMLEGIPADGGKDEVFSKVKEADDAMRDGEMSYVRGDFASAAKAYQRALEADPKLYEAALFAGDMHFKMDQNDKAEVWYSKAIKINPNRETAYRYSATPFLKAGKLDEAKNRYIEAIIAEPYQRLSWNGLNQWAQAAGANLGHPRVEIPTNVTSLKDNQMTINLDPKMLGDDKEGMGMNAWMFYGLTRASWATSEFAKAYPDEKEYRHSLKEEYAALNGVVEQVKRDQKENKIKKLDPSLANLVNIADAGLLEPFILFAKADRGIAQDYGKYRDANRDKLRRYIVEFVTK